jgi:hypothetical protein
MHVGATSGQYKSVELSHGRTRYWKPAAARR